MSPPPSDVSSALSPDDLSQLEERGIAREEAERQLALLKSPPPAIRLARACGVGDGVRVLAEAEHGELLRRADAAAAAGRVTKFVPASGAASRMFQSLMASEDGAAVSELLENLERFPFFAALSRSMGEGGSTLEEARRDGDGGAIVARLLESPGLSYRTLPKGLLDFHRYPEGSRTAFEEHLVEGVPYLRDRDGLCRFHFTVSEEHRALFTERLESLREPLGEGLGASFEVGFSTQAPATDTLALAEDGSPFRRRDGRLLLRPGGHGALIRNLAALDGDIVVIKNIDNVVPDAGKELVVLWKRLLTGLLVALEERSFELQEELTGEGADGAAPVALEFARSELGVDPAQLPEPGDVEALLRLLDRPLRVCGMVRNEGEPGGGPFWVAGADGSVTRQIVESSQTSADAGQREIFASGTHFNPVDLICGTRDRTGRSYDLERFVDPSAVFIAEKSLHGRTLQALERPGLWNGAMAHWNTVFVEVPAATFAPVKTVFDLLRPAHQPQT